MPDMTQAYEILTGMEDVKLYYHTALTAMPEPGAALSGWTSLGETDGGVTLMVNREVTEHFIDQVSGPVKSAITTFGISLKMNLAVATLENWAAYFGTTIATQAAGVGTIGKKTMPLYGGDTPALKAWILTGKSAYGDFPAQWYFPNGYIAGESEIVYSKEGKALLPIELKIVANMAAAEAERFGVLAHKTANAT